MSTVTLESPPAAEVVELFNGLLGLDVDQAKFEPADAYSIAEYVDADGNAVGYLACDLASSCRIAAALTQIPAGRVDEAIGEGALPESFAENLDEIFNICVNLIVVSDGSRIVLGRTAHGGESEAFEALNTAFSGGEKTQFAFDVARYGKCQLEVASAG